MAQARKVRNRTYLLPITLAVTLAVAATTVVTHLLWPTFAAGTSGTSPMLPISIGGTVFNVPTAAIRMKVQRQAGPQERIDLDFLFPSLAPPGPAKRVTANTINEAGRPLDRIFLSIAVFDPAMPPETRISAIYPRYLDPPATMPEDGLVMRRFHADSPYAGEDLFSAIDPAFNARCTRDATTPGMCLVERRIESADLIFRFPRSWLHGAWRDVAAAIERLTVLLRSPRQR